MVRLMARLKNGSPERYHDIEAIGKLVSTNRRVFAIKYLSEHGRHLLGDLAEARAADEDTRRKTVYISYYQFHLDKLDEWGFVTWNEVGGVIDEGPLFDEAVAAIAALEDAGFK